MKRCLKCGQLYSDETLNFCLNDGELLVQHSGYQAHPTQFADDSPPTLVMNQPRVTNPIDFQSPLANRHSMGVSGVPQFGMEAYGTRRNQTLATLSLVFGIASLPVICCFGGILLGPLAAISGFIAMRNVERDPAQYGGRGLAIGGMVLGIISFLASIVFLLFTQL